MDGGRKAASKGLRVKPIQVVNSSLFCCAMSNNSNLKEGRVHSLVMAGGQQEIAAGSSHICSQEAEGNNVASQLAISLFNLELHRMG